MPQLTRIYARNLKRGDFDIPLGPATVFTGPNWAGKSRFLDAIRLLLAGYLPELGKKNAATFGICSGQFLEVGGTFSNGEEITRRWTLNGDTVSRRDEFPEDFQRKHGETLAVMLNADEYFGLSDRDRVEYVARNLPGGADPVKFSRSNIVARITGSAPQMAEHVLSAINAIDREHEGRAPVQATALVEALIVAITELWKSQRRVAKEMEDTTRGLARLRADDQAAPPLADLELALAGHRGELQKRRDAMTIDLHTYTVAKAATLRRAEIDRQLSFTQKDVEGRLAMGADLEASVEALALCPEPTPAEFADAKRSSAEAASALATAEERLRGMQQSLRYDGAALDGLADLKCCPTCGIASAGWQDGLRASIAARISERSAAIAEQSLTVDDLRGKATAARDSFDQIVAQQAKRTLAANNVERLRRAVAQADQRIASRRAIEAERSLLPTQNAELDARVEAAQGDINALAEEVRRAEAAVRVSSGRAHEIQRLAEAEERRVKCEALAAQAALAGTELRAIQAEIVAAIFSPLLEAANAIFGSVLPFKVALHGGEIGRWDRGAWIGHATFSGAEKALTYAAIQAALASRSPVRLLMLDELGRLTAENADRVQAAVRQAIARGHIDQFVGVDPERPAIYAGGPAWANLPQFDVVEVRA